MRFMTLLVTLLLVAPGTSDATESDLWTAAREGDLTRVKALVASGVDVDVRTRFDVTPIYFAASKGHTEIVKLLLEKGAATDVRDRFFLQSPLSVAIEGKHAEAALLLIEHGAEDTLYSPLIASARQQLPSVTAALLDRGPVLDFEKSAALGTARQSEAEELVAILEQAEVITELPRVKLGKEDLERLVGTYNHGEEKAIEVTLHEGELRMRHGDDEPKPLAALSRHHFRAPSNHDLGAYFMGRLGVLEWLWLARGPETVWFRRARTEAGEVVTDEPAAEPAETTELALPRTAAINWPGFRGQSSTGLGDGQGVPTRWSVEDGHNVLWKTKLPGLGHSSPTVWGNRVFLTTAIAKDDEDAPEEYSKYANYEFDQKAVHTWKTLALDKTTGEVVWQKTAAEAVPLVGRHATSSQANSTPATDGRHVVVVFPTAGMLCYTMDGELVWRKELGALNASYYVDPSWHWGFASSPVIDKGRIILQVDIHEGAFLAAYDLETGRELWKTPRDEVSTWATPMVYRDGKHAEIVTNGPTIRGYDAATGAERWTLRPNSEQVVPTPIAAHSLIYVTTGYPPAFPIYAVRPGQRGDLSLPDGAASSRAIAWSHERGGSYMLTPIVYGDLLYLPADSGRLSAYDARTGERVYRARLSKRGNFTGSPVAADGRLFLPAEEGLVYVVKTGRKFKELAVNEMGEGLAASPAISDGALFVRGRRHLFALGSKP